MKRCGKRAFGCVLTIGAIAIAVIRILQRNQQARPSAPSTVSDEAIAELHDNAKAFIGLYEPMRLIASGALPQFTDTFDEWELRLESLADAAALVDFWQSEFTDRKSWNGSTAATKAENLLRIAQTAGITHGPTDQEIIERESPRRYTVLSGSWPERGTEVAIIQPYWLRNELVIEKGILANDQQGSEG